MPPRMTGPYGSNGPGLLPTLGTIAAITAVMGVLTFACAPGPNGVPEVQAQEAPAPLPASIDSVTVYSDPGGCQYLVFANRGNSSTQVVVRQAPNANGMCVASK